MTISELVAELEAIRGEKGDLYVAITNTCCCYGDWEEDPTLRLVQNDGFPPYLLLK